MPTKVRNSKGVLRRKSDENTPKKSVVDKTISKRIKKSQMSIPKRSTRSDKSTEDLSTNLNLKLRSLKNKHAAKFFKFNKLNLKTASQIIEEYQLEVNSELDDKMSNNIPYVIILHTDKCTEAKNIKLPSRKSARSLPQRTHKGSTTIERKVSSKASPISDRKVKKVSFGLVHLEPQMVSSNTPSPVPREIKSALKVKTMPVKTKAALKSMDGVMELIPQGNIMDVKNEINIERITMKKSGRKRKLSPPPPQPEKIPRNKKRNFLKLRFNPENFTQYTCDSCDTVYVKNVDLQKHILTHLDRRQIKIHLFKCALPEHCCSSQEIDNVISKYNVSTERLLNGNVEMETESIDTETDSIIDEKCEDTPKFISNDNGNVQGIKITEEQSENEDKYEIEESESDNEKNSARCNIREDISDNEIESDIENIEEDESSNEDHTKATELGFDNLGIVPAKTLLEMKDSQLVVNESEVDETNKIKEQKTLGENEVVNDADVKEVDEEEISEHDDAKEDAEQETLGQNEEAINDVDKEKLDLLETTEEKEQQNVENIEADENEVEHEDSCESDHTNDETIEEEIILQGEKNDEELGPKTAENIHDKKQADNHINDKKETDGDDEKQTDVDDKKTTDDDKKQTGVEEILNTDSKEEKNATNVETYGTQTIEISDDSSVSTELPDATKWNIQQQKEEVQKDEDLTSVSTLDLNFDAAILEKGSTSALDKDSSDSSELSESEATLNLASDEPSEMLAGNDDDDEEEDEDIIPATQDQVPNREKADIDNELDKIENDLAKMYNEQEPELSNDDLLDILDEDHSKRKHSGVSNSKDCAIKRSRLSIDAEIDQNRLSGSLLENVTVV